MRKLTLIAVVAMVGVMVFAGMAMAFYQADYATEGKFIASGFAVDKTYTSTSCGDCHGSAPNKQAYGPHGGYTTTTTNCQTCHVVHSNAYKDNGAYGGSARGVSRARTASVSQLLPKSTVTANCNFCHDLSGTDFGPYSMAGLTSSTIKSAHRVTNVVYDAVGPKKWLNNSSIPGGDITTGGSASLTAGANDGAMTKAEGFTCDSCHTPHGLNTVDEYLGESNVKEVGESVQDAFGTYNESEEARIFLLTSRLLKKTLQVNGSAYTTYGSAWCAGCHQGRLSMNAAGNYNHPVDEAGLGYDIGKMSVKNGGAVVAAGVINTGHLAVSNATYKKRDVRYVVYNMIGAGNVTYNFGMGAVSLTPDITFKDPRSNAWYAMTPNDAVNGGTFADGNLDFVTEYKNVGKGPVCQQCHASARAVNQTFISWNDLYSANNPKQMSFPHVSKNVSLLVEAGDDLCTNCHGANNLP